MKEFCENLENLEQITDLEKEDQPSYRNLKNAYIEEMRE
jgi:hypothetical protein